MPGRYKITTIMAIYPCPNCHAPVADTSAFCPRCGCNLNAARQRSCGWKQWQQPRNVGERPKTYMTEAIILTCLSVTIFVLLSLPFGVVSIIYASRVENMWLNCRYDEARAASAKARQFFYIGLIVGIAPYVVGLLLMLFGIAFRVLPFVSLAYIFSNM